MKTQIHVSGRGAERQELAFTLIESLQGGEEKDTAAPRQLQQLAVKTDADSCQPVCKNSQVGLKWHGIRLILLPVFAAAMSFIGPG